MGYEPPISGDPGKVAKIVEALTRPGERREVAPRLTRMASTMPSQGDAGGVEFWMKDVWEAVGEFSTDVILQALVEINKSDHWRPTPARVREQCFWVGRRRLALQAMMRRLSGD